MLILLRFETRVNGYSELCCGLLLVVVAGSFLFSVRTVIGGNTTPEELYHDRLEIKNVGYSWGGLIRI